MQSFRYWGIIPAAGVGARMNTAIPKQYLHLNGKPIIEHTLNCLLNYPRLEKIVLVLSDSDSHWQELKLQSHPKILTVEGGTERCHSVLNALNVLANCAASEDWVVVHDVVRPCLQVADIDKLIMALENHPVGGLLGARIPHTVKRVTHEGQVLTTLDRNELWCALTPQMFRFALLRNALQTAINKQHLVTDEASAIEFVGAVPMMVEGRSDNIKITRLEDLALAEFYFNARQL